MNIFKQSFLELKQTKVIVITGFLLAIALILENFEITIPMAGVLDFTVITTAIGGMFFGPVVSSILCALTDILGHIISPKGAYFWGWTFNGILSGAIYGLFLYRKRYNINSKRQLLTRLILARILVAIFVHLMIGTLWYSMLVGKGYFVLLPARFLKEFVATVLHCILIFYILSYIKKIKID